MMPEIVLLYVILVVSAAYTVHILRMYYINLPFLHNMHHIATFFCLLVVQKGVYKDLVSLLGANDLLNTEDLKKKVLCAVIV